jgi:hypothetical protein
MRPVTYAKFRLRAMFPQTRIIYRLDKFLSNEFCKNSLWRQTREQRRLTFVSRWSTDRHYLDIKTGDS